MRVAVWNTRAALLYSLGGWTTLGAMIYYNSTSSGGESGGRGPENECDPQANQAGRKEVFTRETALGFKVTTVVTYKDVQPPLTRLLRHVVSYFGFNDDPPSEK